MKKLFKKVSLLLVAFSLIFVTVGCVKAKKTPVINAPVFAGVEDVTIEKGTTFLPLEGVSVTDVEDGVINLSAVSVDARSVNVNVEGVYVVTYTVYDADGNETKVERKVTVVYTDVTKPELYGVADVEVQIGDPLFTELAGVSAIDGVDGDLTASIELTGSVNVWKEGLYQLTYKVADKSGNVATAERKVTVSEGNFGFDEGVEAALTEGKASLTGGEINEIIANYGLVKLFIKGTEGTELTVSVAGCAGPTTITLGAEEAVMYFRFSAPLEGAELSVSENVEYVKYSFSKAGDKTAPVITREAEGAVVIPAGFAEADAKKEILNGITAEDNLEGNVTQSLVCDLSGINLNTPSTGKAIVKVSDSIGNEATMEIDVIVAKKRDTHIMEDPEFNNATNAQINVAQNSGGSVSWEYSDGEFKFNIVSAGGWASGDSPYLSGINTTKLVSGNWYVFQTDVKADVARAMQIRAGLELWADPWIENFRPVTRYQIGTEWTTIYYLFYVGADQSSDGSANVKFELQLGSIDWSAAESNNVVYFDNMQFYLLSINNSLPEITEKADIIKTYAVGAEMPDFKAMVEINDLEDGAIEVTDSMIDASDVDMSAAGQYTVVYTVTDEDGGTSTHELTINVIAELDTEGPVITISSAILTTLQSFLPVKEGFDFTDVLQTVLGAITITDNVDGSITPTLDMIDLDGLNVTSAKVGTFNLSISCKDSSGNDSNVITLPVTVIDGKAPTFVGVRDMKVYQNQVINPLTGVEAYDTTDGAIKLQLANITGLDAFLDNTGKVVGAAGDYQVTYTVEDEAGNEATATCVFHVDAAEYPEYNYGAKIDLLAREQILGGGSPSTLTYGADGAILDYKGPYQWYASAIQLKYTSSVQLQTGVTYKLLIEAKADIAREFVIYFVDNASNKITGFEIADTGNKLKVGLTTDYYVYEYEFTPANESVSACTFEIDWDWESWLLNANLANKVYIKQLAIIPQGENTEPEPILPIVLDDFEGYADDAAMKEVWAKRYSGANYTTGFELMEQDGNHFVKFEYGSDNQYILKLLNTLPTLTNDYKYFKFDGLFAEGTEKLNIWFYWSGSQNGFTKTLAEMLQSDGSYYFPLSATGHNPGELTCVGIAFNYRPGAVAYLDNFEFVAELPPYVDNSAPVITLSAAGQSALAATEFVEGGNVSALLSQLGACISIVDDTDGEIAFEASMLDLGGLNPAALVHGTYTITITATDEAGNVGTLELPVTVHTPSVTLDDFEGYADDAAMKAVWAKRYSGANYNTGFQLIEQEGNHAVQFNYASDNKYIFKYIGTFPTLSDGLQYLKFDAIMDAAVDKVELWFYWSGNQNGFAVNVSDLLQPDGSYYYKLSNTGHKPSEFVSFGIAFNYKGGSVAYFDNIEFIEAIPPQPEVEDTTAPVIAISAAGQAALAAAGLKEGDDATALIAQLASLITITDNVDGSIAFSNANVDLGGLTPASLVAGTYTITITCADAAGNVGELELPVTVAENVEVEYDVTELVNLDFEEYQANTDYNHASIGWTVLRYESDWTEKTSGTFMRNRANPAGTTRLTNMAIGWGYTYQFTYNAKLEAGEDGLGTANSLSMKLGNWWSNAQVINLKVYVTDMSGNKHYVCGDASTYYQFAKTTDLVSFSWDFESISVKSITIVAQSAVQDSTYLYVDDIVLAAKTPKTE